MRFLSCLVMTALVGGCAGIVIGNTVVINESAESVARHIVVGQTSKSDVEGVYGTPTSKSYDSAGIESWYYGSTAVDSGQATSRKSLQVQFGKGGIAIYYLLTDADPQQGRKTTSQ